MFETIKLNKEYWKNKIPYLKYGVPNPLNVFSRDIDKFSEAMTSFNFSGVYKTTQSGRHKQTQLFLKNEAIKLAVLPVILDIGASDGSTSLDFLNTLNNTFKKYFVTDYNIKCTYCTYRGYTYFFNTKNACFLVASKKFVFYPANKTLFSFLFKKPLLAVENLPKDELLLISKGLQEKQIDNVRIQIRDYNIFEPWVQDKADIVVVGNLLNQVYFTDSQISTALKNCYDALTENGILSIIRNFLLGDGSEVENATIFKKNTTLKSFEKIHEINSGVEVANLVLSLNFEKEDRYLDSALKYNGV